MIQELKIQQITLEELPKILGSLDVDKTTHLALIGPDEYKWPFNYTEEWPMLLGNHIVLRLNNLLSGFPRELLQFKQLRSLVLWRVGIQDAYLKGFVKHFENLTSLDLAFNLLIWPIKLANILYCEYGKNRY